MSLTASPANNDTYQQLGGIVRQLHDALQSLGYDHAIRRIANEIPDAREIGRAHV